MEIPPLRCGSQSPMYYYYTNRQYVIGGVTGLEPATKGIQYDIPSPYEALPLSYTPAYADGCFAANKHYHRLV